MSDGFIHQSPCHYSTTDWMHTRCTAYGGRRAKEVLAISHKLYYHEQKICACVREFFFAPKKTKKNNVQSHKRTVFPFYAEIVRLVSGSCRHVLRVLATPNLSSLSNDRKFIFICVWAWMQKQKTKKKTNERKKNIILSVAVENRNLVFSAAHVLHDCIASQCNEY